MKRFSLLFLIFATVALINVRAEIESIDLKALAKKARPAVMLLVVTDAAGKEIATGTGFLVSSDGKLITNHHVIEGAASAVAKSENGGLFPVEGMLADDPKNDLVLLKLKGKDLPFLPLGKSENIEVGTRIAIIGSPLGLEGTMSEGIVSAVRELQGDIRKLQITAAISQGSSGSPVMNAQGDVVGIAAALMRNGQALNFAVPVEFGIRLMARVTPSTVPQLLDLSVNTTGEDAIYSDHDFRNAWAAKDNGDYVKMLKLAKVVVTRYPDSAAAWYLMGYAFGGLNFTDDEIAAFRQVIKIRPDFAEAWNNLGFLYIQAGRTEEAIEAYRRAIKIKPDDAQTWYNLGMAYHRAQRFYEAIAAHKQVVKIKPDDAAAWWDLGVCLRGIGQRDEASAAFQRAKKLKPELYK